jgi:hypothetical protein
MNEIPMISKNTIVAKSISLIPRFPVEHVAPGLSLSCAANITSDRVRPPLRPPPGEVERLQQSSVGTIPAPKRCSTTALQTVRTKHGPHTIMVRSANYVPDLGISSRTISVHGPRVGAVDVRENTLNCSVHVQLSVNHRSFQALADSGASVSCINDSTFALIRDVALVPMYTHQEMHF